MQVSQLSNNVKSKIGDTFELSKKLSPLSIKVSLLLHAHVVRVPIDASLVQEQDFVVETSVKLCSGLLQIAMAHNWLNVSLMTIELQQVLDANLVLICRFFH